MFTFLPSFDILKYFFVHLPYIKYIKRALTLKEFKFKGRLKMVLSMNAFDSIAKFLVVAYGAIILTQTPTFKVKVSIQL